MAANEEKKEINPETAEGEKVEKEIIEDIEILKKKLEEKENEAKEYYDLLIRLKADFENYKKRVAKEKEEFLEYANEELLKKILSVVDNLERALDSTKESKNFDALYKGLEMILKQFRDILKKEGVIAIESVGKPFDPVYHEAIMQVPSEDQDNIVVEEIRKGYMFKNKVLRPAMVTVAKKQSSKEGIENGEDYRD